MKVHETEHSADEGLSPSPAERGFRMPAEWEPHKATWLTWPHDEAHWPGTFDKTPPYWARMAKELEGGEEVHILLHDEETERIAREMLEKNQVRGQNVYFHHCSNNFAWARDHGPIFVKNAQGHKLILHWTYNAWGGKYEHELDARVPTFISEVTKIPSIRIPMVLEGGSIDVNGKGSLLTTESCLLHPNRNPHLTKEQIEARLRAYLGVTNILWLGDGILGDDTDGHVDDLTRFVGPHDVVTMVEEETRSENYKPLQENLKRLEHMEDEHGNRLTIHAIPLPKPIAWEDRQLPASYANFYIGNEVVLLPVFNDPNDKIAVDTLQRVFPTRRIAAIDARDLVWGLGAFHCVTQQEPK